MKVAVQLEAAGSTRTVGAFTPRASLWDILTELEASSGVPMAHVEGLSTCRVPSTHIETTGPEGCMMPVVKVNRRQFDSVKALCSTTLRKLGKLFVAGWAEGGDA